MCALEIESLPALPAHALSHINSRSPLPPTVSELDLQDGPLLQSASFTQLPQPMTHPADGELRRNYSESLLPQLGRSTTPVAGNKDVLRRSSTRKKKRYSEPHLSSAVDSSSGATDQLGSKENNDKGKPWVKSVSGTIKGLARRSWISPAPKINVQRDTSVNEKRQSRSPKKATLVHAIAIPAPVASRSSSRSSKNEDEKEVFPEVSRPARQAPPPQHSPVSSSLSSNTLSIGSGRFLSRTPSSLSLSSHRSFDSSSTKRRPRSSFVPADSLEKLSTSSFESLRKKDPLWAAFRSLESELSSFQAKSSIYRTKVVRSVLLPFLSKHAEHPSNHNMRAEDLDRRCQILNKWWVALLDVLTGNNNHAISATDRPAIFQGIIGIMTRPEWRVPHSPISSSADVVIKPAIPNNKSTHSLHSVDSDFLVDSVHHTVRNMFSQNLLSQMAFVVDRLSMKTAPASLVTFCGTACAYAFFFCPGIADILVRLWHLTPNNLRRVFTEFKIDQGLDNSRGFADTTSRFPAPVRALPSSSLSMLTKYLRRTSSVPTAAANIAWYGPWIRRWSGRESDLLFAFVKSYHMLVAEHLQPPLTTSMKAGIPGLIYVHAQLLTVLESTLHRQAGQARVSSKSANHLEDPDARIPFPLAAANATRSMAENRLLMLLRDVVGDNAPQHQLSRELYVSSFDSILKAATGKISLYNNDACIVLCDFLDEFLPLMSRYSIMNTDATALGWEFWQVVCQKMISSHHTLTQVRLISFLYSNWSVLTFGDACTQSLVLDWLLEPTFFEQLFSHWCPMVRHYFHRLLCWRIARCDSTTEVTRLNQ